MAIQTQYICWLFQVKSGDALRDNFVLLKYKLYDSASTNQKRGVALQAVLQCLYMVICYYLYALQLPFSRSTFTSFPYPLEQMR